MRIYEFQYILCCCLMPLHCILLSLRNYVSIHPMLLFNSYPLSINFNVLAVSIHPMLLFNFRVVICSNPRTTVSIHPMLLFNCKFSQFPGSPSPVSIHPMLLFNVCSTNCYTCQKIVSIHPMLLFNVYHCISQLIYLLFQYILCCCLTSCSRHMLRLLPRFNTSYVVV